MAKQITRTNADGSTTTITLYTWIEARDIAWENGTYVRRLDWEKWLYVRSFIWQIHEEIDGIVTRRVAQNYDFSVDEFRAYDWTTEPWDFSEINPGGGTGGGETGGGSGGDTGGGGGTGGGIILPKDPWSFPPTTIDGGGGGGGGGNNNNNNKRNNTPSSAPLSISVGVIRALDGKDGTCYQHDGSGVRYVDLSVAINTSGPSGVYMLSVSAAGRTKVGTAYNGFSGGYEFHSVPVTPEGTLTVTATITQGSNSASGSGSYSARSYCCDANLTPEQVGAVEPVLVCQSMNWNTVASTRPTADGGLCITCDDYMCMSSSACPGDWHMEPYTDAHGIIHPECICRPPEYLG